MKDPGGHSLESSRKDGNGKSDMLRMETRSGNSEVKTAKMMVQYLLSLEFRRGILPLGAKNQVIENAGEDSVAAALEVLENTTQPVLLTDGAEHVTDSLVLTNICWM